MPDTTDPELCSLITNMCNPPKNFGIPETEQLFRFVWFEEFPSVCYCWWENRTCYLPCVLFGHKNERKSLQKNISKMANSNKKIQKNIKMLQREYTKRDKYYFIDF